MKNVSDRLYQIPVPIVALTGGIACGKTTVAKLFQKNHIPLISADELVKEIYQEPEAQEFIKTQVPAAIVQEKINFAILRDKVFSDSELQKKVEEFIYKRLPEKFLSHFAKFSAPKMVVYDVPLLFEKNLDTKVDKIICVYCPKLQQMNRLIARDNITVDLAEKILKQQIDIEVKKNQADMVIHNTQDLAFLENEFKQTLEKLKPLL